MSPLPLVVVAVKVLGVVTRPAETRSVCNDSVGIEVLAPSLAQLFNLSLSTGRFPNSWKIARVAPIHNKGPKDDRSNNRPISVLSVISRLFEKLVFGQLYSYLDRNKPIFCKYSGFRRLHSILTCLLRCTNDWYMNIDRGEYTAALFIDLKKAFDTVDHEILLAKLNFYGLEGRNLIGLSLISKIGVNTAR